MNPLNKKIMLMSTLLAFSASGHVLANPTNVAANEASSSKVATVTDSTQDNSQANRLHQANKQTQLRQQIIPKKSKKFHRTIYPMFP